MLWGNFADYISYTVGHMDDAEVEPIFYDSDILFTSCTGPGMSYNILASKYLTKCSDASWPSRLYLGQELFGLEGDFHSTW